MTTAALVLFVVYLVGGFVVRTLLQWRRTGDTGFRGISGHIGTSPWWAGVLFAAALIAGFLGPVAALMGLPALPGLDRPAVQGLATLSAVAGIVATFITQAAMGTSWRIGVEPGERTTLITSGPFAWVRNPIFTAMAVTGAGLAFMVPNAVAVAGLTLLLVALELQVRVVEEPYLIQTHRTAYTAYAAATGRFIPGLGRLTPLTKMETK